MGVEVDGDQTGGDTHLAVLIQERRDQHPVLVRRLAGRWEQGLRGLLGLVGVSGLVGAPLAVDRLSGTTQTATGVLLAAVLATAAGGLALVMSAAYGPARLHLPPESATENATLDWDLGEQARKQLRWGRGLAFAALGLLTVAVAVVWLNPGTDTTAPMVRVETTTGVTYCGPLLDAPPGTVALNTAVEGRVELRASDLDAIHTTSSCNEGENP